MIAPSLILDPKIFSKAKAPSPEALPKPITLIFLNLDKSKLVPATLNRLSWSLTERKTAPSVLIASKPASAIVNANLRLWVVDNSLKFLIQLFIYLFYKIYGITGNKTLDVFNSNFHYFFLCLFGIKSNVRSNRNIGHIY